MAASVPSVPPNPSLQRTNPLNSYAVLGDMNNIVSIPALPPEVVLNSPTAFVLRLAKPLASAGRRGRTLAVTVLVSALAVVFLGVIAGPHATLLGAVALFVGILAIATYELLVEATLVANATTNTLAVEYRFPPSHRKVRRLICDAGSVTSFSVNGHVDTESDLRPHTVFVVSANAQRKRLPLWATGNPAAATAVAAALGRLFDRPWHAA